jgi:hypothetical protein
MFGEAQGIDSTGGLVCAYERSQWIVKNEIEWIEVEALSEDVSLKTIENW